MNLRIALLVVAVGSLGWGGFGYLGFSSQQEDPPGELLNPSFLPAPTRGVYSSLKRSWFQWDELGKTVTIDRRERETTNDPWVRQTQELSASYFILDARSRCNANLEIEEIFVTGVYESGVSTIERWRFTYPMPAQAPPGGGGGYVPLDQRPLPGVSRSVVFQGQELGHIRSIEADPEGRFLLALTLETAQLYRIDLPSGAPQLILSPSTLPELSSAGGIVVEQHVTQGRMYRLTHGPRWAHGALPADWRVIVLPDADNDGVFETAQVYTPHEWKAGGYHLHDQYTPFCGTYATSDE